MQTTDMVLDGKDSQRNSTTILLVCTRKAIIQTMYRKVNKNKRFPPQNHITVKFLDAESCSDTYLDSFYMRLENGRTLHL